jgi:hypothetical protein
MAARTVCDLVDPFLSMLTFEEIALVLVAAIAGV